MFSILKFTVLAFLPLAPLLFIPSSQGAGMFKVLEENYDESSGQPMADEKKIEAEKFIDILFWLWHSYKLTTGGSSNSSYWYNRAPIFFAGANQTAGNGTLYYRRYYGSPSDANSSSPMANGTYYSNGTAANGTYLF